MVKIFKKETLSAKEAIGDAVFGAAFGAIPIGNIVGIKLVAKKAGEFMLKETGKGMVKEGGKIVFKEAGKRVVKQGAKVVVQEAVEELAFIAVDRIVREVGPKIVSKIIFLELKVQLKKNLKWQKKLIKKINDYGFFRL